MRRMMPYYLRYLVIIVLSPLVILANGSDLPEALANAYESQQSEKDEKARNYEALANAYESQQSEKDEKARNYEALAND